MARTAFGTAFAAAALLLHVATGWATAGHKIIAHIAGQEVTWSATTTMGFLPFSIKIEAQDGFNTALGGRTLSSVVTDPITYGNTDAGKWSLGMRHWFVQDSNATSLSMKECNTKWCLPLSTLNYTQRLHDQLVLAESGTPQPPSRANNPSALSFMSFLVGEIHDPSHVAFSDDNGGTTPVLSLRGVNTSFSELWEGGLLDMYIKDYFQGNWTLLALNLTANRNHLNSLRKEPGCIDRDNVLGTLIQWAGESFDIVKREDCWRKNGTDIATASPNASSCSTTLDEAWVESKYSILRDRLTLGGLRLSLVLDHLFIAPEDGTPQCDRGMTLDQIAVIVVVSVFAIGILVFFTFILPRTRQALQEDQAMLYDTPDELSAISDGRMNRNNSADYQDYGSASPRPRNSWGV